MDDFLRKIQLSESAIQIYVNALGKFSHSYYELFSIVPKLTMEQFNDSLNELIDAGLLVKSSSKKQDMLMHYSVLPPILPILNYYENISANLPDIKKSIQDLMFNTVKRVFHENKIIQVDSILNTFQEIKKDIDEDSIIQKQEIEDIVEGMEDLKQLKKNLSDLHQEVKNITQIKFADLIKIINSIKSSLIKHIKKKETISLIEQLFKEKFERMVADLTNNLHELIEKEFEEVSKPIDNMTELIFQYRNDFKMLLLNMLTNFETNLNKIYELLKENNDNLSVAITNLENKIAENLNVLIQNSINEVSSLNKPIENVMKSYLQEISISEKRILNNVWIIKSVIRINEAIQNLIINSKESVVIIIPHIENHIALEQFDTISSNLKIKITASEAHTNSIVKSFKNIKNILYRNYQNENLIILKGDQNILFLGLIQESKDPLFDFIGIGSNFKPLIKLIDPLVDDIWENSYSDTFHAAQVAKSEFGKTTPTKTMTTAKPIIKMDAPLKEISRKSSQPDVSDIKTKVTVPSHIQEIQKDDKRALQSTPKTTGRVITPKPQITDLKLKLKEKIEFVAEAQPKTEDEAAIEINNAFNNLILKLNNLKGDEFGNELQNIADLILEKKGFSVTLHKVRSIINKFKEKLTLLDANDKSEILENIENWKKKLF
ncbi:MAG: hypothetical protein ACFE9S_08115 [Candidatus Hermodarchaeota archaeon]